MQRKYTIQKSWEGYMHFIELDAKTLQRLTTNGNKRIICILNNKEKLHAAIIKNKEGIHYIMIAAKYLKKLHLKKGDCVYASLEIDQTELQFNIPEEFSEVLATDPEAEKIFKSLTPGNKRGLIAMVNMVKSSFKKIERSLKIAEKLKSGITSPQKMMK